MKTTPILKAIDIAGSQNALAKKTKCSQTAIWKIVNGITKQVSAELAVSIERATGVMRWEFRPDLFPEPNSLAAEQSAPHSTME